MTGATYEEVVEVDTSIYPIDVIIRACYRLTDRSFIYLARPTEGIVSVSLTPKSTTAAVQALRGELTNLLLDELVRASVREETSEIREHMVRCALAEVLS